MTDHARCIKAKYNSGITNRGGDNSGVLISPAGMDKDAILSFVDICTGKAKLTREARCILSAYNRTISNWGGSSGVFYGCRAVVTPDREEKRQTTENQELRGAVFHRYGAGSAWSAISRLR